MRKLVGIAVSCIVGLAVAITLPFLPARPSSAEGSAAKFLAAPASDTVFLLGPLDGLGGDGRVVRCKDDGSDWRCAEVKNAGRSE
jgi:hypothetical protein